MTFDNLSTATATEQKADTVVDPPTYGPWHGWFAWRPVRTDWHGWRWLVPVQRRMWRGGGTHGWDYTPTKEDHS